MSDVPVTDEDVKPPQKDSSWHEESNINQLIAIDIDDAVTKQIEHESQRQGNNDSFELLHTSGNENLVSTDTDNSAIKPIDCKSQENKDSFDNKK